MHTFQNKLILKNFQEQKCWLDTHLQYRKNHILSIPMDANPSHRNAWITSYYNCRVNKGISVVYNAHFEDHPRKYCIPPSKTLKWVENMIAMDISVDVESMKYDLKETKKQKYLRNKHSRVESSKTLWHRAV